MNAVQQSGNEKPTVLSVNVDNIRAMLPELTQQAQWVVWRLELRDGKWTKVPYVADMRSIERADATNADTWRAFEVAVNRYQAGKFDGIGYVFSPNYDYIGFDIDHCIDGDPNAFQWQSLSKQDALDLMTLNTYAEISPSGTGVKGVINGQLPMDATRIEASTGKIRGGRKLNGHEMYEYDRFFTITGWHIVGTPPLIRENQAGVDEVYTRWFPPTAQAALRPHTKVTGRESLTDDEVVRRAEAARNGPKFAALMRGDYAGYTKEDGTPDHSRADLALCSMLAWQTDDAAQIERIVSYSGLNRPKWQNRADYRQWTIDKALQGTSTRRRIIERAEDYIDDCPPEEPPIEVEDYTPTDEQAQAVIARLQAAVEKLQREVQLLRLENRILRNPDLKRGEAATLITVAKELTRTVERGQTDERGYVKLPQWKIAKETDQSDSTVAQHIKTGEKVGLFDKVGKRAPEPNNPYKVDTFFRPASPRLEDLYETLADYREQPETKKQWGGSRVRCNKHPHAPVIETTVFTCSECREILETKERLIEDES